MVLINKEKIINQSRLFFNQGRFVEALNYLKDKRFYFFLSNKSSFYKTDFLFLYGAILSYLGNYKKAIVYLKKALSSAKLDKSEIFYYIIVSYLNIDNHRMAKYYFNKILERSYSPFYIFFSYYRCIRKKCGLNISLESLKEILSEKEENIFDTFTNVVFLMLENKFEFAYELITDEEFDGFKNLYFYHSIYLAIIYNLKKYDLVISYFREHYDYLISIEALNIYSLTLIKIGMSDESLKVLNDMLFIRPNQVIPIFNKAKIYYNKKNYTAASKLARSALKIKSAYADQIYFLLSTISYHLGLLNDVIKFTDKITEGTKLYFQAVFNLSLIYYDLDNFDDAKKAFSLIDEKILDNKNYKKWKEEILSSESKHSKILSVKLIIKFVPYIFIFISLAVFFLLYFFVKK